MANCDWQKERCRAQAVIERRAGDCHPRPFCAVHGEEIKKLDKPEWSVKYTAIAATYPTSAERIEARVGVGTWASGWVFGTQVLGEPVAGSSTPQGAGPAISNSDKPFDVGASDDMVFAVVSTGQPTSLKCTEIEERKPRGYMQCVAHGTLFGLDGVCVDCEPLENTCLGCGNTESKCSRDRMDCFVDGLTVRQCLERYEFNQRNDLAVNWWPKCPMTPLQLSAARSAWSAALRAKQQEERERERMAIVCDDDRWEE